ncbi:MAG: hypothetical protein ACI3U2_06900 [Anaerovibrio sp.]
MEARVKAEINMILDPLEVLVIYKALAGKTMDSEEDGIRKELLEQMDATVCFGSTGVVLD